MRHIFVQTFRSVPGNVVIQRAATLCVRAARVVLCGELRLLDGKAAVLKQAMTRWSVSAARALAVMTHGLYCCKMRDSSECVET